MTERATGENPERRLLIETIARYLAALAWSNPRIMGMVTATGCTADVMERDEFVEKYWRTYLGHAVVLGQICSDRLSETMLSNAMATADANIWTVTSIWKSCWGTAIKEVGN